MRARRCCGVGAPCPVPFFVSAPKVDSGPVLGLDLASLHCVGATPHHVHAGSLFPIKRSRCEQRFWNPVACLLCGPPLFSLPSASIHRHCSRLIAAPPVHSNPWPDLENVCLLHFICSGNQQDRINCMLRCVHTFPTDLNHEHSY